MMFLHRPHGDLGDVLTLVDNNGTDWKMANIFTAVQGGTFVSCYGSLLTK